MLENSIFIWFYEYNVGRFTIGSDIVIDGKKSDGKDQQHSDNGWGGATVNVGSYSESPMIVRYEFREE